MHKIVTFHIVNEEVNTHTTTPESIYKLTKYTMDNDLKSNKNSRARTEEEEDISDDERILETTILATTSDDQDEDGAIFRCVDIMPASSSAASRVVFGESSLTQIGGPSTFNPTRDIGRTQQFATSGSSLTARSNWRVSALVQLPTVPLCYPLERTHVVISLDDMNVQTLTALISSLAQRLSLAHDYESNSQAYLTAEDGTLLSVQLFQDVDEQFGDSSTILEVQRRAGKAETFFYLANKILQVSKGVEHVENMDLTIGKPRLFSPKLEIPPDLLDVMQSSDEEKMEDARSTLNMALGLLKSDHSDSQELGLKLLNVLTDAAKSSAVSCKLACEAILSSGDFGRLLQEFLYADFTSSSSHYEDDLMSSYSDVLKKETLHILANALSVCVNESVKLEFGWIIPSRRKFVTNLVRVVEQSNMRPHEAVLSIRCLEGMLLLFPETREHALDLDLAQVIMRAKIVGECSHANLFVESERVVVRMAEAGLIST